MSENNVTGVEETNQKKKRDRKANFSENEIMLLLREVKKRKDVLFAKVGTSKTNNLKKNSWSEIAEKLSSLSSTRRGHVDVKKKWQIMFQDLKQLALCSQREQMKAGDGLPPKQPPFADIVLDLLGEGSDIVTGITVNWGDSLLDGDTFNATKVEDKMPITVNRGDSLFEGENFITDAPKVVESASVTDVFQSKSRVGLTQETFTKYSQPDSSRVLNSTQLEDNKYVLHGHQDGGDNKGHFLCRTQVGQAESSVLTASALSYEDDSQSSNAPNFARGKSNKRKLYPLVTSCDICQCLVGHIKSKEEKISRTEPNSNIKFGTYIASELDKLTPKYERLAKRKIQEILFDIADRQEETELKNQTIP